MHPEVAPRPGQPSVLQPKPGGPGREVEVRSGRRIRTSATGGADLEWA